MRYEITILGYLVALCERRDAFRWQRLRNFDRRFRVIKTDSRNGQAAIPAFIEDDIADCIEFNVFFVEYRVGEVRAEVCLRRKTVPQQLRLCRRGCR